MQCEIDFLINASAQALITNTLLRQDRNKN